MKTYAQKEILLTKKVGEIPGFWYSGTAIDHTSFSPEICPYSGITHAAMGDTYLNTKTLTLYKCVVGGAPTTAKWVRVKEVIDDNGIVSVKYYGFAPKGYTNDMATRDTYLVKKTDSSGREYYVPETNVVDDYVKTDSWETIVWSDEPPNGERVLDVAAKFPGYTWRSVVVTKVLNGYKLSNVSRESSYISFEGLVEFKNDLGDDNGSTLISGNHIRSGIIKLGGGNVFGDGRLEVYNEFDIDNPMVILDSEGLSMKQGSINLGLNNFNPNETESGFAVVPIQTMNNTIYRWGIGKFGPNGLLSGIYWDGEKLQINSDSIFLGGSSVASEDSLDGEIKLDDNGNYIYVYKAENQETYLCYVDPEKISDSEYSNIYYNIPKTGEKHYLTPEQVGTLEYFREGGINNDLNNINTVIENLRDTDKKITDDLNTASNRLTEQSIHLSNIDIYIDKNDTNFKQHSDEIEDLQAFEDRYEGFIEIEPNTPSITLGRILKSTNLISDQKIVPEYIFPDKTKYSNGRYIKVDDSLPDSAFPFTITPEGQSEPCEFKNKKYIGYLVKISRNDPGKWIALDEDLTRVIITNEHIGFIDNEGFPTTVINKSGMSTELIATDVLQFKINATGQDKQKKQTGNLYWQARTNGNLSLRVNKVSGGE